MSISITERAARRIQATLAKSQPAQALRIGLRSVGCNGLAYTFELADEAAANDLRFEAHGATVLIDATNLPYIDGSELDFVRDGLKESFKLRNPNAVSECGCGESFSVDAEKRP